MHDVNGSSRRLLADLNRTMRDQARTHQRTSLLIVFGMMFTSVGLAIGVSGSYGVLSWIFLGLGVLLPLAAAVLVAEKNDTSSEEQSA